MPAARKNFVNRFFRKKIPLRKLRNCPASLAARGHFAVSGGPLRTARGNLAPVLSVFFLAGNVQVFPVYIFLYGLSKCCGKTCAAFL